MAVKALKSRAAPRRRLVGKEVSQFTCPSEAAARVSAAARLRKCSRLRAVMRGFPAEEAVVERRDGLAQLQSRAGRTLIRRRGRSLPARAGSAGERSRFGLALSQVAPGRIGAAVAELVRFRGDVDDAGPRDGPEGGMVTSSLTPRA